MQGPKFENDALFHRSRFQMGQDSVFNGASLPPQKMPEHHVFRFDTHLL